MLSRICLQRTLQCLYCPFEYRFLTSSMTFFHSSGVYGNIVRSVTGPGRGLDCGLGCGCDLGEIGESGVIGKIGDSGMNGVIEEDFDRKEGDGRFVFEFVAGLASSLRGISRPILSDCFDCCLSFSVGSMVLSLSSFAAVLKSRKGSSADLRDLPDEEEDTDEFRLGDFLWFVTGSVGGEVQFGKREY